MCKVIEEAKAATGDALQKSCSSKFNNIHRKTFVLESFLNKITGLQAYNFTKKRLQHTYFPVNIAKLLRTPILKNICEWLIPKRLELFRDKRRLNPLQPGVAFSDVFRGYR